MQQLQVAVHHSYPLVRDQRPIYAVFVRRRRCLPVDVEHDLVVVQSEVVSGAFEDREVVELVAVQSVLRKPEFVLSDVQDRESGSERTRIQGLDHGAEFEVATRQPDFFFGLDLRNQNRFHVFLQHDERRGFVVSVADEDAVDSGELLDVVAKALLLHVVREDESHVVLPVDLGADHKPVSVVESAAALGPDLEL